MTGTDPLLDLLTGCVVRIDQGGEFRGTGFFVAPGEVLTCAHVAYGGKPITVSTAEGVTGPAEPITELLGPDDPRGAFYPQPDAAILRVPGAPGGHACVRLEAADPAVGRDTLQLTAFTKGENAPEAVVRSGATLRLEALFEQEGCTLYKLRGGQVIGGFSGGPLLNLRSGAVCAIVDSSRSEASDLGGFGVPLAAIAGIDPGLLARNRDFHRSDDRWDRSREDQARLAAERDGRRERLPLLPPVLELDWGPDVPLSDLLRPRYAVVPFVPRGDLLDQVMRWRESDDRLRVLVLIGAGGFGKTRTAAEVCRAAENAGWTAGYIDAGSGWEAGLAELLTWPGRIMLAVDYAETRPELVTNLLSRLLRRRNEAPCRVVLVVRQGGSRQSLIHLFATGDARDELARVLRRAELAGLGHGERELDRRELFTAASGAFVRAPGGPAAAAPDLHAEHFERPLFVLAAALLTTANPGLDVAALSAGQLMSEILDQHEAGYWKRADEWLGLGLRPEDREMSVALAAMCGLSSDQDDERLVRLVPSLRDASAERAANVVRWLRDLYGQRGSLEPDLLAEVLVGRVITMSPALTGAVLDVASDTQLTRALLVLSRVAGRSDAARLVMRDTFDDQLGERLGNLVERAVAGDTDLVTALRLACGATRPLVGAILMVTVGQHVIPTGNAATGLLAVEIGELAVDGLRRVSETQRPQLAGALIMLSELLSQTGRPAEGLPLIEEAITQYRILARADPGDGLLGLAHALRTLSARLGRSGRPAEGLSPAGEAVTHYRALAQADPTRYRPDLADALDNQSYLLAESGRPAEGLTLIGEAVTHYRALAQANPTRYLPDLASALGDQAYRLAESGRPAEGLAPAEEAVTHYRALVQADPTRYRPSLANALIKQSYLLAESGRPAEGLAPAEEALTHYRALAQANPTRYLPDLANALINQAIRLGASGQPADGLPPIEEAVTHYRALAQADPTRHLRTLLNALTNQATLLDDSGRPAEGLAPIEEAVTHYRALAQADPTRYRPDLANALVTQADLLDGSGRPAASLISMEEALTIRRALAHADPTRFLPGLANALSKQSERLGESGRATEGLALIEEAVTHYRALAQADPTRYLPEFAIALGRQADLLAKSGRPAEGLTLIEEAVTHYRALAQADPTRYLPTLASALANQARILLDSGRSADTLAPIEEAVTIRRLLARADATRFLPDLAQALGNQASILLELGRPDDVDQLFDLELAEYAEPGWSRSVLLLVRSRWVLLLARSQFSASAERIAVAVDDAVESVAQFDAAGDRWRWGQARRVLRLLRAENTTTVDKALSRRGADLPVWLRLPEADSAVRQLLVDWVETASWKESFDFLAEHAEILLTDRGEASLEHLIDDNPGQAVMDQHLGILRDARERGAKVVGAEFLERLATERVAARLGQWIASGDLSTSASYLAEHADELLTGKAEELLLGSVTQQPELLRYLGFLGVARRIGVEESHALVTDRAARDAAIAAASPVNRLPIARLAAGLDDSSAELQFAHALAALDVGGEFEAVWAMTRCRDASASWERPSFVRRLDEFAAAHPELDLDLAPVRQALADKENP